MFYIAAFTESRLISDMEIKTNRGENFEKLAEDRKLIVVFLRHFGCTFCRETMAEISEQRAEIEARGFEIVLVHMVASDVAEQIMEVYDLGGIRHVSDPHQLLYRRFGLGKVTFGALFGVRNWYRAFVAGLVKGHLIGKPAGDPFQMPGVFVFHKGKILSKFDYKYVSDLPNFAGMAQSTRMAS